MLRLSIALAVVSQVLPSPAMACEDLAAHAAAAPDAEVAAAFANLAQCDRQAAERQYTALARRVTSLDAATDLSIAAIDHGIFVPVQSWFDDLSYDSRKPVADAVGSACQDHPRVSDFLQNTGDTLRGQPFKKWQPAFSTCRSADYVAWLRHQVTQPPTSAYSDHYQVVLGSWVANQRAAGLNALENAAIKAASAGPFRTILDALGDAVQPERFVAKLPEDRRKMLDESLVRIGQKVPRDAAKDVMQHLATNGSTTAAGTLLGSVYPERIQPGGVLLWGAAAVETCDDDAVIHWTTAARPSTEWPTMETVANPLRSTKAKLKCDTNDAWPVVASEEPAVSASAVGDWVKALEQTWTQKGLHVKLREESLR